MSVTCPESARGREIIDRYPKRQQRSPEDLLRSKGCLSVSIIVARRRAERIQAADCDINSLSNFKRNTPEFLRQLKKTGQPVVLTINGKAELVVQDTGSYQKLLEVAERVEELEALQEAVDEMKAGKGTPIEEMFEEMRQILARKKAR